jgi:hypothetical protein
MGKTSDNEQHPDAWERFERAVDVVAKSPPQHRTKSKIFKSKVKSKIIDHKKKDNSDIS